MEQLTYLLFLKMAHERTQPPYKRGWFIGGNAGRGDLGVCQAEWLPHRYPQMPTSSCWRSDAAHRRR